MLFEVYLPLVLKSLITPRTVEHLEVASFLQCRGMSSTIGLTFGGATGVDNVSMMLDGSRCTK